MTTALLSAVALLLGGIAYLMTMDIILTSLWTICSMTFFGYYIPNRLKKFQIKTERARETFHFINAFVIALSVKKTPSAALEIIKGQLSVPLRQAVEEVETTDTFLILEHLKTYFETPSYDMFLTVIDLYVSQGGSIISMAALLLAMLRIKQTDIDEKALIAKRKLTNFVILWALTLVVLLFSRFGISFLFEAMIDAPLFKVGISSYFMFMLYSVYVWMRRYRQGEDDV